LATANKQFILRDNHKVRCLLGFFGAVLAWSLMYSPVPALALLAVAATVYLATRPYELLLVMVFLIPFNFVSNLGPIPVAAELLKVIIWFPLLVHQYAQGKTMRPSRFRRSIFVLAALTALSLARAHDLAFSLKEGVRFASNLGLLYVVPNLVDSRNKVLQVLRVLSYSSCLVCLYGFYQFAIQDYGALFWIVNPRLHTALAPGRSTFWPWRNRISSVLTSEMELGHYLNLCIPASIVLWLESRARRSQLRWLLIAVALLAALVLTFTFGAWAALVAGTVAFAVLLRKRSGWKLLLAGAAILAIGAFVVLGPLRPYVASKLFGHGIGSLADDLVTRQENWTFAFHTWWNHPLIGVGEGNYQRWSYMHAPGLIYSPWAPIGGSPHETYLYILAQFGLVGFVAMLTIMIGTLRRNWGLRASPKLGIVALGLAFALTVNLIGWFSDDSTLFSPHAGYLVWLYVALSEAVWNVSRAEIRAEAAGARAQLP
jgi:O-antigen ligase